VSCSADGSGWSSTLRDCEAFFPFEFTRGTSEPVKAELTAGQRTALAMRLVKAERRLRIVGFADTAEAATPALRQKLGLSRAERMRKLLVSEGFDPARIDVTSTEAAQAPAVHITFEPRQAVREDFPVGSPEHDKFCGQ
jgi:flagellar motor protein MotB